MGNSIVAEPGSLTVRSAVAYTSSRSLELRRIEGGAALPEYEPVIGLEVHAQLRTKTKIFCGCEVRFGAPPNSLTCPVCLGMPGALPVLNRSAVTLALRLALALGCTIRARSVFARKNYFYPDLPKGYQISQYDLPLAENGRLAIEVKGEGREVGIRRVHMEEDAGKLIHEGPLAVEGASIVDFNRSGTPLVEIVGEADLRSPEGAYDYLTRLKSVLTYTEVCDGNMEEGSLRCDANVSIREKGAARFGTRVELKNLNSFRNVERALRYEIARQETIVLSGGAVAQQTLLYDADSGTTRPMRAKEEAHDYRYFPDPDLMPLTVTQEWIDEVHASLPELPAARKDRIMSEFALGKADAHLLTLEKPLADYFEAAVFGGERSAEGSGGSRDRRPASTRPASSRSAPPREVAKWVLREIMTKMKEEGIASADLVSRYPAAYITKLVRLLEDGIVNGPTASDVFELSWTWVAGEAEAGAHAGSFAASGAATGAAGRPAGGASERPAREGVGAGVTLFGFGLRKPAVLSIPRGSTLREILEGAGVSAQGFIIGVNGKRIADFDLVPPDGAVLTGAPWIGGAASLPESVAADPERIVADFGLGQISDEEAILRAIEQTIAANPGQLEQYRKGKPALFGYFVGQIMKAMGGRADPAVVNRLLKERLPKGE